MTMHNLLIKNCLWSRINSMWVMRLDTYMKLIKDTKACPIKKIHSKTLWNRRKKAPKLTKTALKTWMNVGIKLLANIDREESNTYKNWRKKINFLNLRLMSFNSNFTNFKLSSINLKWTQTRVTKAFLTITPINLLAFKSCNICWKIMPKTLIHTKELIKNLISVLLLMENRKLIYLITSCLNSWKM